MLRTPRRLITAVALAALFATTAAGFPAHSIPPAKWANQVCGSVQSWVESIQAKAKDVQSELSTKPTVAKTKAELTSFLGTLTSETSKLVDDLKDSDTPDTPKGKGARLALIKGFSTVGEALHRLKVSAKAVSLKHPKLASAELQRLGAKMQSRVSNMGRSFGNLDRFDPGKHLKKAFNTAKACKALSN